MLITDNERAGTSKRVNNKPRPLSFIWKQFHCKSIEHGNTKGRHTRHADVLNATNLRMLKTYKITAYDVVLPARNICVWTRASHQFIASRPARSDMDNTIAAHPRHSTAAVSKCLERPHHICKGMQTGRWGAQQRKTIRKRFLSE